VEVRERSMLLRGQDNGKSNLWQDVYPLSEIIANVKRTLWIKQWLIKDP